MINRNRLVEIVRANMKRPWYKRLFSNDIDEQVNNIVDGVLNEVDKPESFKNIDKTFSGENVCNRCGANIKFPNDTYYLFDGTPVCLSCSLDDDEM